jgi:chromosome segregation ATPase
LRCTQEIERLRDELKQQREKYATTHASETRMTAGIKGFKIIVKQMQGELKELKASKVSLEQKLNEERQRAQDATDEKTKLQHEIEHLKQVTADTLTATSAATLNSPITPTQASSSSSLSTSCTTPRRNKLVTQSAQPTTRVSKKRSPSRRSKKSSPSSPSSSSSSSSSSPVVVTVSPPHKGVRHLLAMNKHMSLCTQLDSLQQQTVHEITEKAAELNEFEKMEKQHHDTVSVLEQRIRDTEHDVHLLEQQLSRTDRQRAELQLQLDLQPTVSLSSSTTSHNAAAVSDDDNDSSNSNSNSNTNSSSSDKNDEMTSTATVVALTDLNEQLRIHLQDTQTRLTEIEHDKLQMEQQLGDIARQLSRVMSSANGQQRAQHS